MSFNFNSNQNLDRFVSSMLQTLDSAVLLFLKRCARHPTVEICRVRLMRTRCLLRLLQ